MGQKRTVLDWAGTPWGSSSIDAFQTCGLASWEGHDLGRFSKPTIEMSFGSAVHRIVAHTLFQGEKTKARTRALVEKGFNDWKQFTSWERPEVDWDGILKPADPAIMADLKLTDKRKEQARRAAAHVIRYLKTQPFSPLAVEVPRTSRQIYQFSVVKPPESGNEPVVETFESPVTCSLDIMGMVNGKRAAIDIKTTGVRGAEDARKWQEDQLQNKQVAIQRIIAAEQGAIAYHLVVAHSNFELIKVNLVPVKAPHVNAWLERGVVTQWQQPRYGCTKCSNFIPCWRLGEGVR